MSENLCQGGAPTFLPNRARSGLNPALSPHPLAGFKGPTSKGIGDGKEGKRRARKKRRKGRYCAGLKIP